ncbi:S-layer homology domain-containing protein [Paenibacillus sp. DMB20]|uniref:S-layer homology domain-containing protein n=1 Tax=Paenibacillus sp. DMB20 TaxID=1642570 RepID=UPI00069A68F6|nr:S-layer homology domain-containing protein [Paenibacillus sp. DMB20]
MVTDYERMAMAVTAIGKDPRNIAGYDFLEKIYNHERMKNQGTNGLIFALLALDADKTVIPNNALWTRDKLIQNLLDQQNADGGFPISKESNAVSDIDMTAMALQALAKYQDRKEVKAATDKALTWLSSQQLPNGGFKAWGVETSESISQVILALSSLGNSLDDKRFVKQDGDLLKALRTYLNKDGGFAHGRGEASNYMATQQALLALNAYDRMLNKHNGLYDMTDVKSAGTSKPETSAHPYADKAAIAAWAKEAVNKATDLGLMQGTSGEAAKFEPKRELTRAEFAALIVRYAGLKPKGTSTGFKDVDAKAWYAGYVATAKEKGLISGVTAHEFAPNQAITRQEMATILVRLKGLPKNTYAASGLKDQKQVSAWALPYVKYAYQSGLMSGNDGYFKPQQHVTREMAAVVIVRLHDIQ